MLDFGECLLLDTVYMSSIPIFLCATWSQTSSDFWLCLFLAMPIFGYAYAYFIFVQIGVKQAVPAQNASPGTHSLLCVKSSFYCYTYSITVYTSPKELRETNY